MKMKTLDRKIWMIRIFKFLAFLFAIVLAFSPASILNTVAVDSEVLVTVLGVDKMDNGFEVSAILGVASDDQNGSVVKMMIRGEGETIRIALDDISGKMGKNLETSLCGVLVFGDTFGNESVLPIADYLLSNGQINPGTYLMQANKMSAKSVLGKSIMLSDSSITRLSKLIEYNSKDLSISANTLLSFVKDSNNVSKSSYLPAIEIIERKPVDEQGSNESGTGDVAGTKTQVSVAGGETAGDGTSTEIISIENIFLFNNGKKVKMLTKEQSRGYTWADKKSQKGYYAIKDFAFKGKDVGTINIKLYKTKFKLKTDFVNGKPTATFDLNIEFDYDDKQKLFKIWLEEEMPEKELLEVFIDTIEERIKEELRSVVDESVNENCDVFQLTTHMHRFNFKDYKKYPERETILQDTEIKYNVKVKMT